MNSTPTNTGEVTYTAVMPCYRYENGKLTILDHEQYRKLKKRNAIIRKALEDKL